MPGDPSIEHRLGRHLGQAVRGLGPNERLASIGALVVAGSLLLPWYGVPIQRDLVQTGLGAFSFATAALLLTAGSALFLSLEVGDGYRPPRPLSVGALLIAAGIWAGLILLFQMYDRPVFTFAAVDESYDLRYGIFVAFAGAAMIAVAGARRRSHELPAREGRRD